ncbi:IclR family transcriptional regulator [Amycolatopsis sp. GM8]|uniref:IclR family transcriptional regulator n=1 Tax=Amycolatopsis sp. GM8 TaxID=2896530 RepID=UPI001F42F789|nr:hypothetical protein [Amycolatopsis sp. GM8]
MVARRSPQTERIVGLINFLSVDDSGHGVLLSELARRLGVSMATCYPMLEALIDAGFLVRHPTRKTFHLGPALISAGAAAAKQDPQRALAREAMIRLGEELDLSVWLYSKEDGHFRIIDQAWHSRAISPIMRVGERFACRPPGGAAMLAWMRERHVERWLDQASLDAAERAAYYERLTAVREAGYAVALDHFPVDLLRTLVFQLTNAAVPAERSRIVEQLAAGRLRGSDSILTEPEPDEHYSVQSIDAPIFDGSGAPMFVLGLVNLPRLSGTRITELARCVKNAASSIDWR